MLGHKSATAILAIALKGDTLAIVGSALAIALSIANLKTTKKG